MLSEPAPLRHPRNGDLHEPAALRNPCDGDFRVCAANSIIQVLFNSVLCRRFLVNQWRQASEDAGWREILELCISVTHGHGPRTFTVPAAALSLFAYGFVNPESAPAFASASFDEKVN